MLQINGKTFMNLQEAVQWLLDNNALPFQSSANYVANTEIGLGTIVNPSPAKVRIGSLIFFADSKVSTVIGLTENGFMVSDQYNDLVDDVVYVSNVALNASGHLIVSLSNGTDIDAGLIKQVSNFNINASQHLIVDYNDGTYTDLGAIFSGNVTISGDLTVTGNVNASGIYEDMSNYSFSPNGDLTANGIELVYVGVVKTGNKITFVIAGEFDSSITPLTINPYLGTFSIPSAIGSKLYPMSGSYLDLKNMPFVKQYNMIVDKTGSLIKYGNSSIGSQLFGMGTGFDGASKYAFRLESTFLLSDNLAV